MILDDGWMFMMDGNMSVWVLGLGVCLHLVDSFVSATAQISWVHSTNRIRQMLVRGRTSPDIEQTTPERSFHTKQHIHPTA